MKTRRKKFSDQIKQAVVNSGLSHYRICMDAGIDKSTMSRFMSGKGGLSISSQDRLADVLKLDVVTRKQAMKV
ncbi:MAG: helix-turn-helix transcriptional regulator [Phycisphaerae bacterium]|nr:helix-turn-helix transcriptional regulator [Phycisphaerae bacterium]